MYKKLSKKFEHPNKQKHDRQKIIFNFQKYTYWNNYVKMVTNVNILKWTTGVATLLTDESNSLFANNAKLDGGLLSESGMFQLNQYLGNTVTFPQLIQEHSIMEIVISLLTYCCWQHCCRVTVFKSQLLMLYFFSLLL